LTEAVTAYAVVVSGDNIDAVYALEDDARVRQAGLEVDTDDSVEVRPVAYYGLPPISDGPTELDMPSGD
jgi:hypothetical protein